MQLTLTLIADTTEVVLVHQKAGQNLTIDGGGKTLTGQFYVDDDGRYNDTDTLTISNFKFAYDASTYDDAFIDVPSTKTAGKVYTTGKYNYAHNLTVKDCEFTGGGTTTIAVRVASGAGAHGLTLQNLTVTGGHSAAQLVGVKDLTITGCNVTGVKNGINISGGDGQAVISGNTVTADAAEGYTLRVKDNSAFNVTLSDNTFSGGEGIVNNSKSDSTIAITSGSYDGPVNASNSGNFVISGGTFDEEPAVAFIADGYICKESEGRYVVREANYVVQVGETKYESFEEAVANADDDVITLLADGITYTLTPEVGTIRVAANGHSITVNPPEGDYILTSTTEDDVTTYSVAAAVAMIGDVKYASLADAVAAVPADGTETTIVMIANEAIEVEGYAITIAAGKNVILDLNGHQVIGKAMKEGTSALIRNLGVLTITDTADGGELIGGADPTWTWDGSDDYSGSYASNLIRNEGSSRRP